MLHHTIDIEECKKYTTETVAASSAVAGVGRKSLSVITAPYENKLWYVVSQKTETDDFERTQRLNTFDEAVAIYNEIKI